MDFNEYSHTFLFFFSDKVPDLLAESVPGGDVSIVDLGAGDGTLLIALGMKGLLPNSKNITAVDLSEERCDRLRQYTDFRVINGDATNVPEISDSSADFVICTQVIEHVDQFKLLGEIKRILRPNGRLYIASVVKKRFGWWYFRTPDGRWALDPTHLREYESQEQFEEVIRSGGFTIEKTAMNRFWLSVLEFVVRRIVVPIFKPEKIHGVFMTNKFLDFLRKRINIHPPGYFIIEVVARNSGSS
jgi:ubiquinone/menaquinone biosynthesis C-methylase UbiE